MTKLLIVFVFLLCVYWLWSVLSPIFSGIFYFTFDQARDLLWVKNQIDFHTPSLIGPWGSLAGVYFGPLWFWLLALPLFFSQDPTAATIFNALIILATILLGGVLFKKWSFLFLALAFLSPLLSSLASYAFSQHLLPLFSLLIIYGYFQFLETKKTSYLYLSALAISLMFSAEPPTALLSFLSFPLFIALNKIKLKPRNLLWISVSFLLPIAPLVFFDIKHNFLQLHSVLAYFSGTNNSLSGVLPFSDRIFDRLAKISSIFYSTLFRHTWQLLVVAPLLLFSLPTLPKNNLQKALLIYLFSFYVSAVLFPPELKSFYLDGLTIWFLLFVALVIKNKYFLVILVIISLFNLQLPGNYSSAAKSTSIYRNQKAALDWIYHSAQNQPFSVYTYSPAIYDFPQQYLFLTYGLTHYHYLPAEFSYLPNVPEYVQSKDKQLVRLNKYLKSPPNFVYLIIDPSEERASDKKAWRQNFSSLKILSQTVLQDKTVIQMLRPI